MLRHACGYALANKGRDTRAIQGWLGHRSITSTAVYTALAPNRFKDSGGSERPIVFHRLSIIRATVFQLIPLW
jgi:type 1 fimbriae regulatory protein FimB/type 1 fimbriae regulatory protein FimE